MKKTGIIGYGSMGKMLLGKFSESGKLRYDELYISSRTVSKIEEASDKYKVMDSNIELAASSDIVFICIVNGDLGFHIRTSVLE